MSWTYLLTLAVVLVLLLIASFHDLRRGEIPHWIAPAMLVWVIVARLLNLYDLPWLSMFYGFCIITAIGVALYWLGGLGAGDVKLLAALGVVTGTQFVFPLLLWIALAGAVLAVIAMVRGKRAFPYAPAIAGGLAIAMLMGGGIDAIHWP